MVVENKIQHKSDEEKTVFPASELEALARFMYKVYKRKRKDGTLKIYEKGVEQ